MPLIFKLSRDAFKEVWHVIYVTLSPERMH